MSFYKKNVLEAIGNTPIVKLNKVAEGVESEIFVKLEYMNPGGSIKERIGNYILNKAFAEGKLKPGGTIIEGTSGNTGVGLAMWAAVHGFKCIFVLADKQSQEKIQNLRAFGAKVVVCPTNVEPEDPRSYYSVSKKLADTIPNSYFVSQYDNPYNSECHYRTTGPEIYEQTKGEIDVFMAGVGTGGTISGTGKYLKEKNPNIKIVGVDCDGSILAHYAKTKEMGVAKPYVLEGIGEDFLPKNVHFDTIDDWVVVGDRESFLMTRKLLTHEGIYCGGSCGAAVMGAIKYAKQLDSPKKILVILPDSGNRYNSKIFNDDWMRENGYWDSTFNVMVSDVLQTIRSAKRNIISIQEKTCVGDAIKSMELSSISQLPVFDGKQVVGVVSEHHLLRPVFEGKLKKDDSVSLAMTRNFQVVESTQMLSDVADALLKGEVVLVSNRGNIIDILTNSDVLNFVSRKDGL